MRNYNINMKEYSAKQRYDKKLYMKGLHMQQEKSSYQFVRPPIDADTYILQHNLFVPLLQE